VIQALRVHPRPWSIAVAHLIHRVRQVLRRLPVDRDCKSVMMSSDASIRGAHSELRRIIQTKEMAILEKWVPYSQRYLVLGLVGLALWLVSGIALNKYRCE